MTSEASEEIELSMNTGLTSDVVLTSDAELTSYNGLSNDIG